MPEENQQTTDTNQTTNPPVSDQGTLDISNPTDASESIIPIAPNDVSEDIKFSGDAEINASQDSTEVKKTIGNSSDVIAKIIEKIADSRNILIALSSNPTVDEISSAIGLSLLLDKLGKRATAIYSGTTPNALEFLKPEETFEPSADALQDFVIAINKEKADHLRYKLDGDYVRIYITPYKTKVSKEDLEFSYGDFNVDLVIALNVANGIDLDEALREHGRIMHDATVIDITTGDPGKLGEIEWSDKTSSSVSEMITNLVYSMDTKEKINRNEATAFLTGIVAATNRFSAPNTTADTMKVASRLMESGADQQLISKNISTELENELYGTMNDLIKQKVDPTALDIEHQDELPVETEISEETITEEPTGETVDTFTEVMAESSDGEAQEIPTYEPALEIDHQSSDEEVAPTSEPESVETEIPAPEETSEEVTEEITTSETPTIEEPKNEDEGFRTDQEKIIPPSSGFDTESSEESKYGKMLEDALAEPTASAPTVNPAASVAPTVATEPDVTNIPDINYAADGDMLLPPPPTPPIDFDANSLPVPDMPAAPTIPAPNIPAPGTMPPDSDPTSFQIPGM